MHGSHHTLLSSVFLCGCPRVLGVFVTNRFLIYFKTIRLRVNPSSIRGKQGRDRDDQREGGSGHSPNGRGSGEVTPLPRSVGMEWDASSVTNPERASGRSGETPVRAS